MSLGADRLLTSGAAPSALGGAGLIAHARRAGTPRRAHDPVIAAHAAETGRTNFSRDAKARLAAPVIAIEASLIG